MGEGGEDRFFHISTIGRLLRPDIVQFHFACLGTEIFLRELTLSRTPSSNPKSSRSVDLHAVFSQTAILSSVIYDKFFHCSTTWMDEDTRLHN